MDTTVPETTDGVKSNKEWVEASAHPVGVPTFAGQTFLVHHQRLAMANLKLELEASRQEWEKANVATIGAIRILECDMMDAERRLREMGMEAYQRTGSKAPAPGIGIRVVTRVIYDPTEAERWARKHDMFMRLDAPSFEKFAKNNPGMVGDVAILESDPQVTIATDLGRVLAKGDRDGDA